MAVLLRRRIVDCSNVGGVVGVFVTITRMAWISLFLSLSLSHAFTNDNLMSPRRTGAQQLVGSFNPVTFVSESLGKDEKALLCHGIIADSVWFRRQEFGCGGGLRRGFGRGGGRCGVMELRMVPPTKGMNRREDEIRRKIMKLKKEGKIKKKKISNDDDELLLEDDEDTNASQIQETKEEIALSKLRQQRQKMRANPVADEYADKIKDKLGKRGRILSGLAVSEEEDEDDDERDEGETREAYLGSLAATGDDDDKKNKKKIVELNVLGSEAPDVGLNTLDEEEEEEEEEEEALVQLVAEKLSERDWSTRGDRERLAKISIASSSTDNQQQEEKTDVEQAADESKNQGRGVGEKGKEDYGKANTKTTSGVGGTWTKNKSDEEVETYKPSRGSWGAFPRPKDISKAYGGGKRVGAGVTQTVNTESSVEDTRERLRRYREKVGIDVQSEKDHKDEIEEALAIAGLAMQRGVYTAAVSALEKVTPYCGTNSKVGGKVFLELAMAYEAVGRTQEAITVYTTLSNCLIEDIKFNARRLLYGIEAMNFMRNEAKSAAFSRKSNVAPFVEATGLAHIAEKFDDRYNTAYIDLEKGGEFYKKLTESVVRSNREARQILLLATGAGEVERLKVVQALRSLSSDFENALKEELEKKAENERVPVAVMDGKPILPKRRQEDDENKNLSKSLGVDKFILATASQMMQNLDGEWRLQLTADKKGDGVNYFNSTLSWQKVDTNTRQFRSVSPSGFRGTRSQSGNINFNNDRRILSRTGDGGSRAATGGMNPGQFFGALLQGGSGGGGGGAAMALSSPQQILCVDSVLLVTRYVGDRPKKTASDGNVKDYFAVWRRVESGTYSDENTADDA